MKTHKHLKQIIAICTVLVVAIPCFIVLNKVFSLNDFESTLKLFPESYRQALIALHDNHPEWIFEPVETNLDFNDSVNAESGKESLVPNGSAYSDMLKSKNTGDYNYSGSSYIVKDSGFVSANGFSISYFMDPRNFLTDEGIMQFEKLSFDSSMTVDDIELAVKGTFMANTPASYYDASGNLVTVKENYSKIIYDASKKYNINPCFLAKKIINEVGTKGSGATTGKNKNYPGIYNFCNIGANDGGNAMEKGLAWASTGTTYGRPWTTPKKAIYGGAEFLAKSYINVGQHTNYFQRFNVNPAATHKPYSHQYMTSLAGVSEIAYSTWQSYKNAGTLEHKRVFSIPVYTGMSANNTADESLCLLDGLMQEGTLTASCKLRSEPNAYSTYPVVLASGTKVNVVETVKTDSLYPDSFLKYPVWAKITCTVSGTNYEGYVYANFVKLSTYTNTVKGTYSPTVVTNNEALEYRFLSNDVRVATITDDNKINFIKEGDVVIYAYDSLGHFTPCRYVVSSKLTGYNPTSININSISATGATVSFTPNKNADKTCAFVFRSDGTPVFSGSTDKNSIAIKNLEEDKDYKVYLRGSKAGANSGTTTSFTFSSLCNTPEKPTGVKATQSSDLKSVTISWSKAKYASSYKIYALNSENKYEVIGITSKYSFTLTEERAVTGTKFKVRAYKKIDGKNVYSSYSSVVTYTPKTFVPKTPADFSCTTKTASSISLSWGAVANATEYRIYKYNPSTKKYETLKTIKSTQYTVKNLNPFTKYNFKVKAITTVYSQKYYGTASTTLAVYTLPSAPTTLKAGSIKTTSLVLSWKAVSKASGYRVYMYDSAQKKYVKLADVTTNKYTVKGLKAGKTYTFKVKAYSTANSTRVYSTASAAFKATTKK